MRNEQFFINNVFYIHSMVFSGPFWPAKSSFCKEKTLSWTYSNTFKSCKLFIGRNDVFFKMSVLSMPFALRFYSFTTSLQIAWRKTYQTHLEKKKPVKFMHFPNRWTSKISQTTYFGTLAWKKNMGCLAIFLPPFNCLELFLISGDVLISQFVSFHFPQSVGVSNLRKSFRWST